MYCRFNTTKYSNPATDIQVVNIFCLCFRGVLARSIILAQNASPTFTHVYASLTSVINSRFPQNGELILRRVAAQFRRSFRRNLKVFFKHNYYL